jgi:hypothetical protein
MRSFVMKEYALLRECTTTWRLVFVACTCLLEVRMQWKNVRVVACMTRVMEEYTVFSVFLVHSLRRGVLSKPLRSLLNSPYGTSLKSMVVYDLWENISSTLTAYGAHCLKPTHSMFTPSFQAKKATQTNVLSSQWTNTTHTSLLPRRSHLRFCLVEATLSLHSHSNECSFKPMSQ